MFLVLLAVATGCAQTGKIENARIPANADEIFVEEVVTTNISVLNLRENGGSNNGPLVNCGGHATVLREGTNLKLKIRDSNCGSYNVNGSDESRLTGEGNNGRGLDYNLKQTPGSTQEVTVGSKKFFDTNGRDGNADRVRVYIAAAPAANRVTLDLRNWTGESKEYRLPNCNGSIRASIENNKVNIKISDTNCGLFDILSNEGSSLSYDAKSIPSSSYRYGGSFTLPTKVYAGNYGYNGVMVRIYNRGGNDDRVLIKFGVR